MQTIIIEWPCSHDAADGEDAIMQLLEAGYDEGPLIVVAWTGRGPGRRLPDAPIFVDASHYIAHLAMHGEEVSGERWVGLVRGSARTNGDAALAALAGVRRLLPIARARPAPSRRAARAPAYAAYAGEPGFVGSLRVEHVGEGLDELRRAYPVVADGEVSTT